MYLITFPKQCDCVNIVIRASLKSTEIVILVNINKFVANNYIYGLNSNLKRPQSIYHIKIHAYLYY